MVNVFCTKKLEAFVTTEERTLESYTSDNNWNGQLILIGRRKCLYFIHKRTLYAVLILDILKKDLLKLDQLFFDGLVNQLKIDNLYQPQLDNYLKEHYFSLKLFKTDNDQKTLGTLRDNTMHLKSYIENKPDKIVAATRHQKHSLNKIPIGSRKFQNGTEMMKSELENYLI
jgi:hypothetical protein